MMRNSLPGAFIACDMKSFFASCECVSRGLDPLKANLLVADESRSDNTICLAVSPALKAIGVPSRPRLFEAKAAIKSYEKRHHHGIQYIIATPHMAEYERISAQIYSIYLRYAAPDDIHVYSIDEAFIDCSPYLHFYQEEADRQGVHPAHVMAMTMIRDVLKETGITATIGIGTNLYLAKVAMDIVAKKAPPDKDGVRIAELNEISYRYLLWNHKPITDFWQVGPGTARKLGKNFLYTMGDVAKRSLVDEELFYELFGIDGEILVDHAWGLEPVTMEAIKGYTPTKHSLSYGQVLSRPYKFQEARVVFSEMIDNACSDMFAKGVLTRSVGWTVGYDYKSLEACPYYSGPISWDYYGRPHPRHNNGTVKLRHNTNAKSLIAPEMLSSFDKKTDHALLFRQVGIWADDITQDEGSFQLDLFTDMNAINREQKLEGVMQSIRKKYGANSLNLGINFRDGATGRERNMQIGGHRA